MNTRIPSRAALLLVMLALSIPAFYACSDGEPSPEPDATTMQDGKPRKNWSTSSCRFQPNTAAFWDFSGFSLAELQMQQALDTYTGSNGASGPCTFTKTCPLNVCEGDTFHIIIPGTQPYFQPTMSQLNMSDWLQDILTKTQASLTGGAWVKSYIVEAFNPSYGARIIVTPQVCCIPDA